MQHNFNEPNLLRYRIFYRNEEDFDFSLFEWPGKIDASRTMQHASSLIDFKQILIKGQIAKTNEELKGVYYYTYNTSSTFDCYNECIKNPTCDFAQFKNENDDFFLNCLLFNVHNRDEAKSGEEVSFRNKEELMKISSK